MFNVLPTFLKLSCYVLNIFVGKYDAYIAGFFQITSESLRSIASLPKLEVLLMAGCPFVDDYGLQFLESGCPSLQVKYFIVEYYILEILGLTLEQFKQINY